MWFLHNLNHLVLTSFKGPPTGGPFLCINTNGLDHFESYLTYVKQEGL